MKKIMMLTALLLIAPLVSCKGKTPVKDDGNPLCFTCLSASGGTLFFVHENIDDEPFDLQYSYDKKTWRDVDTTQMVYPFVLNSNESVYFRGDNPTGFSTASVNGGGQVGRYSCFEVVDGDMKVSGNVMSLIQATKFDNLLEIPCDNCFYGLFSLRFTSSNSRIITYGGIVDASELLLPATTLTKYCYSHMFQYNVNLKKAPQLPATQLTESCYERMFYECEALNVAPDLLADNNGLALNCYGEMFEDSGVNKVKVAFDDKIFGGENTCEMGYLGYPYTNGWLWGCSSNGVFSWKGPTEFSNRSFSTIPDNWDITNW